MIIISSCLAGTPCRYDGNANTIPWVKALVNRDEVHLVCPEELGGLPTPRKPCEINANGRVVTADGVDFTEAFHLGAVKTLEIAKKLSAVCAILKCNSPSCGRDFIYNGEFSKTLIPGNGMTTQLLLSEEIKVYNEKEAFDFYKPYDVLWFDLDDTLMDFKKTQRDAFEGLCKSLGFTDPEIWPMLNELYEHFNHPLWKQLELGEIDMDTLRFSRIAQFLQAIEQQKLWPNNQTDSHGHGHSHSQKSLRREPQIVADLYEKLLGEGDTLLDGALECITRLSKHYRLALITNGINRVQSDRLSKSPITAYFEQIVVSETVGISKPNRRIFEHTAQLMNLKHPLKVLMIGDSLASDITGGEQFQIDTCWYNPKRLRNATSLKPKYTISHLDQLTALLCEHPFVGHPEYTQLLTDLSRIGFSVSSEASEVAFSSENENKEFVLMRIDGYCGSGKTTLGIHLSKLLGAQLVRMDDFYVPEDLKTPDRFATPGHNVHYERFHDEVLIHLKSGRPAIFRPYHCADGSWGEPITIRPEGLVIVEGSYSAHPTLDSYYHLKAFVKTSEKLQKERILSRSSEDVLERFITKWIPLEMAYFEYFNIEAASDYVIVT